jgi:hypothetical protein
VEQDNQEGPVSILGFTGIEWFPLFTPVPHDSPEPLYKRTPTQKLGGPDAPDILSKAKARGGDWIKLCRLGTTHALWQVALWLGASLLDAGGFDLSLSAHSV